MNDQDRSQKKIFEEEQAHLTETHRKLREMRDALEAKVEAISEKAAKEKEDIRSNLSLNFDNDTDSMETYIEFEAMSHSIDQYNIEQNAAMEKLGRVKRLLKAPYFARVRLLFDPEEEPEDYYIGSAGIAENAWQQLVIDWRSPIAETYYNQENGKTLYMVNGNRVDVDLQLRRQYDLKEDRLFSFFDTQVAIEDPMLLKSLASRRTDKMKAITATIQKEQNAVIRCENVPVLMVSGIAGSGKTSVLLQRIAYLFYKKRDDLRPEQVYLLTVNPVFRQYIDQVLPDLGEENPRTITWRDFIHIAEAPDKGPNEPAKESDLRKIESALPSLIFGEEDFRPVMQRGRCVLSRSEIRRAAEELAHIEAGPRFVRILADRLSERARIKIRRMERGDDRAAGEDIAITGPGCGRQETAGSAAAFNAMDPYAGDEGAGRGNEDRVRYDYDDADRSNDNRIRNDYGGAFSAIEHFAFIDIEKIGRRILGRKSLSSAQWIWLKMLLTGICDRNVRYVMIDEVDRRSAGLYGGAADGDEAVFWQGEVHGAGRRVPGDPPRYGHIRQDPRAVLGRRPGSPRTFAHDELPVLAGDHGDLYRAPPGGQKRQNGFRTAAGHGTRENGLRVRRGISAEAEPSRARGRRRRRTHRGDLRDAGQP